MDDLRPLIDSLPAGKPLIVAGPCSAESERQTLTAARALKDCGISVFRAGLWKPRTHPGGFEGVGSRALPWLRAVKEQTGLPVATEVGSASHLRQVLRHGIDIVWIGARTSANPFAVQEIADELASSGKDVGVMVKNPVSPDLELWIGALQRFYNAGVRRLAAVHRGFSSYGAHDYRNPPQWSIPIELRRRLPMLPVLCDPSHIAGKRELIAPLSQQALDMGFAGLMIESHPEPDAALSDARQQITPERLNHILLNLRLRDTPSPDADLAALRDKIDLCDAELIEVLARRMEVSREIGEYKRLHNLPAVQIRRHDSILRDRVARGVDEGLSESFMRRLMEAVHEESVRTQLDIINSGDDTQS